MSDDVKKSDKSWIVPVAALGAITVIESIALLNGINGVALTTAVGVASGIGGYKLPSLFKKKENE